MITYEKGIASYRKLPENGNRAALGALQGEILATANTLINWRKAGDRQLVLANIYALHALVRVKRHLQHGAR